MENKVESVTVKQPFFTKKSLIIIGVILFIALVVGLNIYRANSEEVVSVKTAEVKQTKLVQTVLASGRVAAADREVLYSQVTGSVKKINVKLGQKVIPGQVLMELNIPDAEHRLLQAQSEVASSRAALAKAKANGSQTLELLQARADYQSGENEHKKASDKLIRVQSLYDQGAATIEELENAKSDVESKKASLDRSQAGLRSAEQGASASLASLQAALDANQANLKLVEKQTAQKGLTADKAGQVMSITVSTGDVINVNSPLITIGDLNNLQVKADITEADAAKIEIGQKVLITPTALPDKKYHGTVKELGLEAVNKTRSNGGETTAVPVVIAVAKGTVLRPGYNTDLEITTAIDKKALVISFEAMIEKNGSTCVYVIRGDRAYLQKIKTGLDDNLNVQVISGLKKGEKVVLNPPADLKDKVRVSVK
ncbi:MAG: efflux RND transporter periplasmic adaptor subunit [Acidobacteriota bacterium]